jgi:hypothetical protein
VIEAYLGSEDVEPEPEEITPGLVEIPPDEEEKPEEDAS